MASRGKKFDNNMRGVLFENNDKRRNDPDSVPDYKGSCEVDGVEYWLSGWWKSSDKIDGDFLSLSLTPKDEKPEPRGARRGDPPARGRRDDPPPERGRREPPPERRAGPPDRGTGFDDDDPDIPF